MQIVCIPTCHIPHPCTHTHTVPQVEAQLSSEDRGRDLAGVQNLLKKHQLLEADITAHEVHTSHTSHPAGN